MATTRIYTAADISGGNIAVPADYNSASNSWHAIGGTPAATDPGVVGGGGVGGGAWSRTDNLTLTPGGTAAAQIGLGDVWVSNTGVAPTTTSQGCLADGGTANSSQSGGSGGQSANCVGNASANGGNGGNGVGANNGAAGGGGGAAGPNGAGANGGAAFAGGNSAAGGGGANGGATGQDGQASKAGNGGANRLGAGAGTGAGPSLGPGGAGSNGGGGGGSYTLTAGQSGGAGSRDAIWTDNSSGPNNGQTAGPGSGGGGGANVASGGQGGSYGGGAGGSGDTATVRASGQNGVLVLIYEPAAVTGTASLTEADDTLTAQATLQSERTTGAGAFTDAELAAYLAKYARLKARDRNDRNERAWQEALNEFSKLEKDRRAKLKQAARDALYGKEIRLPPPLAQKPVQGRKASATATAPQFDFAAAEARIAALTSSIEKMDRQLAEHNERMAEDDDMEALLLMVA